MLKQKLLITNQLFKNRKKWFIQKFMIKSKEINKNIIKITTNKIKILN